MILLTDDQGYGDLSIQGNAVLETPRIDALARESASVRQFWVSPVCSPTRASLLTGRYNYRTGVVDTWVGRSMMDPAELTLAEVLRDSGYATGIFGKWHLGDCHPLRPNDQGFEEALVHRGGGLAQPSEPIENERRYTDPILFHNGEPRATKGFCTDVYFDAAIEFIERARAREEPFFVYLPTNAPHDPFHDVPVDLYEKYRSRDLSAVFQGSAENADRVARIFAMVENIDQNVGRLLDALDRLDASRDTIVIYLHDNGPQIARWTGGLRGTKTGVHEGGIRTPFWVRWPARLAAGTVVDQPAAHIDVLPTVLDAAGLPLPQESEIDGRSLLPLLEGRDVSWPSRALCIQSHRGDEPARYRHFALRRGRWKLLRSTGFGNLAPRDDVPFELFDLDADEAEERDLASEHPEVVAALLLDYDRWFDDVTRSRANDWAPPRIIVGSDHETRTVLTRQDWRRTAGRGWGTAGEWRLHVEGDRSYDATIVLEREVEARGVTLAAGDWRAEAEVSASGRRLRVEGLRLPRGDQELTATVRLADGAEVAAWQLILERR